jgi:cell division protein FtsN
VTRDYKHARPKPQRPLPGWVWLLTGLTMGLIVALLVYLNQPGVASLDAPRAATESASPSRADADKQAPAPKATQRHFDFYTLLPELEVVIPENEPSAPGAVQGDQPDGKGSYVLQAGSFQRTREADSLKANLALLGVEADIQTVTVNKKTWHRVRVGPYANLTQANRMRARLKRNRIETIMFRQHQ